MKQISRRDRATMNGYFLSFIRFGTVNVIAIFRKRRKRRYREGEGQRERVAEQRS